MKYPKTSNIAPLALLATLLLATSCEPLEATPENLEIGVVTISLRDSEGYTAVSAEDAAIEVRNASAYWENYCGVRLTQMQHLELDEDRALSFTLPETQAQIDSTQARFFDEHYLTVVLIEDFLHDSDGDELTYQVGEGSYPGNGDYATVISSYGMGITVLAHELGHDLGLLHIDEDEWPGNTEDPATGEPNLMEPVYPGSLDPYLSPKQCAKAKDNLLSHWRFSKLCRPESDSAEDYCVPHKDTPPTAPPGSQGQSQKSSLAFKQRPRVVKVGRPLF